MLRTCETQSFQSQKKEKRLLVRNYFYTDGDQDHIKAEIDVNIWMTVSDLKKKIRNHKDLRLQGFDLNKIRVFYKTTELSQGSAILESYEIKNKGILNIYQYKDYQASKGEIQSYDLYTQKNNEKISSSLAKQKQKLNDALLSVQNGFHYNLKPELTEEGTSGSYFLMRGDKKKIAIFKPRDEEAYAPNNPRGYTGQLGQMGFRKGILSGESAAREAAAYLIDINSEIKAGVPVTTFVEMYHPSFNQGSQSTRGSFNYTSADIMTNQIPTNQQPNSPLTSTTKSSLNYKENEQQENNIEFQKQMDKIKKQMKQGSLQLFAKHEGVVGDYGFSLFPTDYVHKIAILDIRILNCDRNEENILIKKIQKTKNGLQIDKLIPIDHGLSIPSAIEIMDYEVVWMGWDQAKQPLSKELLNFIKNIDIDQHVKILRQKLKIREICLRNFKIANLLLKKYAAKGYNLFQIGSFIYREDEDTKSPIEEVIDWANAMYKIKKQISDRQIQEEEEEEDEGEYVMKQNSDSQEQQKFNQENLQSQQNLNNVNNNDQKIQKKMKKSTSLPSLNSANGYQQQEEEEQKSEDSNEDQNLAMKQKNQSDENQILLTNSKELKLGTNQSCINSNSRCRNKLKKNIYDEDRNQWDDVYYECIENAMDIVIGAKIQGEIIKTPMLKSKRSRYLSTEFKL